MGGASSAVLTWYVCSPKSVAPGTAGAEILIESGTRYVTSEVYRIGLRGVLSRGPVVTIPALVKCAWQK